ncbi:MAG: hypothetical protein LBD32_01405 [Cytophagales bacterium]|jgi:MATE family multidrug resistance protein|nr:hypothetical protein [Cytophagales bacterium]
MKQSDVCNPNTSYNYILKVTLPLILVSLSNYLMISIDRIILSTISADMMNAITISGNFIAIFNCFFIEIIEKNSIFTSQFYGDKQNEKISICVWQMIFLSLLLIPISLIMAFFSDKMHILSDNLFQHGLPYLQILFSFSFLQFIYIAICTFFIAQGKTYILSLSIIIGCLINVSFSIFFVQYLQLGTSGSAYGTILGYLGEIISLALIFFNKKNRDTFKTHHISWDFSLLKKIFKLGFPVGLLASGSMVIWFIILSFVSKISKEQLTLYNLLTIINLFFAYFSNAIAQAVSSMSANLIAQKDLKGIKILVKNFFMLIIIAFSFFAILSLFLKQNIMNTIFGLEPGIKNFPNLVSFCFYSVVIYGSIEFLYRILQGVCLAGGDTKFVSRTNASIIIFFDFLPIVLLKYLGILTSIWPIILIFLIEPFPLFCIYVLRYKSLKWYNKIV